MQKALEVFEMIQERSQRVNPSGPSAYASRARELDTIGIFKGLLGISKTMHDRFVS
jgi:hypothetical protein